ncbi:MAG: sulfur carrier protein ThiS [Planctomycetota bacterium]
MQLTVNGHVESGEDLRTVADLLRHHGLAGQPCAVEVNATLVPKRDHDAYELTDGDRVEIVTLVGGG